MGEAVNAALLPYVRNEPTPDRRRSILGLLSLPDLASASLPAESQADMQVAGSKDLANEESQE